MLSQKTLTRLNFAFRLSLELALLFACLLMFSQSGGCLLVGQTKPKIHVTCVAENHQETVYSAKTKTSENRDNWRVVCTVKLDEKSIVLPNEGRLILPYPASFHDAMEAIDLFRSKTAPEIVKKQQEETRK